VLLLLHGLGGTSSVWDGVTSGLARAWVAPDLPGHGRAPALGSYDFDGMARAVAARLGLRYLDTGATYRALAWWALERGVDVTDEATRSTVAELARALPLEIGLDPRDPRVRVAGQDVTAAIREPRISAVVSAVATNLEVRAELVRRQRALAAGAEGIVIEGRDITTVVAPDAPVRVLLTASEHARLARRALEVHGSADEAAIEATRDHVVRRDVTDSTVAEFTEAADGVTVLDSSGLTFDETVEAVLRLVEHVRHGR